jgi:hypothetical protein
MISDYVVAAGQPGTIIVINDFHHDVPPAGVDVRTRYEATDKNIKVLNDRVDFGLEALIVGLIIASILLVTGKIIKWQAGRPKAVA